MLYGDRRGWQGPCARSVPVTAVCRLLRVTCVGPMVYGTAFCPMDKLEQVKDLGVAGW